ncbi:sigma-70 family RNA polymerase sigma factor [Arthrobacter tumbae]|uniref:sigma-70 family RNA polymerase sigma factor n=1 Tax=Arthrobacter tumbae TaxID=163874 RepID=UPI00195A71A3|nr:sigma-70 family RNA polymerase sigma factor [Arthrobacter tumbae]MBM7782605.1 RNA polymerase sigma-70 factor (ECF subfamily) [Arthrobacter tumbae]
MSEKRVVGLLRQTEGFDVHQAFAEHARAIYGFALNSVRDAAMAEDCVQETFVRAWRSRGSYSSSRGSERSWLFAIARNVVVDEIRARARRPAPMTDDRIEVASAAVAEADAIDDRITLYSGLAQLSQEHRDVIVAVQLEGRTYQQLHERSGVPVATLRTRMYYGLKALRETLGEEPR